MQINENKQKILEALAVITKDDIYTIHVKYINAN